MHRGEKLDIKLNHTLGRAVWLLQLLTHALATVAAVGALRVIDIVMRELGNRHLAEAKRTVGRRILVVHQLDTHDLGCRMHRRIEHLIPLGSQGVVNHARAVHRNVVDAQHRIRIRLAAGKCLDILDVVSATHPEFEDTDGRPIAVTAIDTARHENRFPLRRQAHTSIFIAREGKPVLLAFRSLYDIINLHRQ